MRTKKCDTSIKISKATHSRLIKDRDEFEKTIGGGKWSIDDTIVEYWKILSFFQDGWKENKGDD